MSDVKDEVIKCGDKEYTRGQLMVIGNNLARESNGYCKGFDEGGESILFDIHTAKDSRWTEVQFIDLESYL